MEIGPTYEVWEKARARPSPPTRYRLSGPVSRRTPAAEPRTQPASRLPGVLKVSVLSIKSPQLISLIPERVRPEGLMPENMQGSAVYGDGHGRKRRKPLVPGPVYGPLRERKMLNDAACSIDHSEFSGLTLPRDHVEAVPIRRKRKVRLISCADASHHFLSFRIKQPYARSRMVRFGPRVEDVEPSRVRFCPTFYDNLGRIRKLLSLLHRRCSRILLSFGTGDQRLDQRFPCGGGIVPLPIQPCPENGRGIESPNWFFARLVDQALLH